MKKEAILFPVPGIKEGTFPILFRHSSATAYGDCGLGARGFILDGLD
jgi:hypothetical protein